MLFVSSPYNMEIHNIYWLLLHSRLLRVNLRWKSGKRKKKIWFSTHIIFPYPFNIHTVEVVREFVSFPSAEFMISNFNLFEYVIFFPQLSLNCQHNIFIPFFPSPSNRERALSRSRLSLLFERERGWKNAASIKLWKLKLSPSFVSRAFKKVNILLLHLVLFAVDSLFLSPTVVLTYN